jgi:hypothetical protein
MRGLPVAHQADEDVLQRALLGLQVLEGDAGGVQVLQQFGDAGVLALGVVGVDQRVAARWTAPAAAASASGTCSSGCASCSVSCFLPSLRISSALSSTRMISPLLMTPMRSAISSASSM